MNTLRSGRVRDGVVIGAGLAGSSMAHVLAELGWDVLLLEQATFPRHKVCGEFLSPEAQASLKALGLYRTVAGLSPARIEGGKLISPKGRVAPTALPGLGWGISRFALDQALAGEAQKSGVELQFGVTVSGVTRREDGFEVAGQSEEGPVRVRARAVLAACGRYSKPGLPPRGEGKGGPAYVGLKCHYEGVRMPPQVELFFFPGGYAGVCPVEGGRVNLCLLAAPGALAQAGKGIPAKLSWVIEQNQGLVRRLAGATALPESEVAVAPVDVYRRAMPWEGMACLGDTAVMIPPLCGDGMAMALRSVELGAPLVHDFLRGNLSPAAWAAAYEAAWRAEFEWPVWLGRRLQAMLGVPLLSELILGLGGLVPSLAAWLVRATRGGQVRPVGSVRPIYREMRG